MSTAETQTPPRQSRGSSTPILHNFFTPPPRRCIPMYFLVSSGKPRIHVNGRTIVLFWTQTVVTCCSRSCDVGTWFHVLWSEIQPWFWRPTDDSLSGLVCAHGPRPHSWVRPSPSFVCAFFLPLSRIADTFEANCLPVAALLEIM